MSSELERPLVSVRIAAYNHEKFVGRALDSVLAQTYPNIELVIFDDGSSDTTVSQIRAWIRRHDGELPVKFRSRQNRGISATLNELVDWCAGDYIVGLSSDRQLCRGS